MSKEKKIIAVTISIMSLVLVCVMFMQFKVVNETDITQIEDMREEELEETIAQWKEKYEETAKKLEDTNQKVNEYSEKLQSNQETEELVKKELKESQKNFGITDVNGDGIVITLTDNEQKAYNAENLLDLINELRLAGAEAISINDERITNITEIVDISSKYIFINSNKKISSPYIVKVIGDRTYLKSALSIKNGYIDLKQKEGYNIEIQEKSNIKIDKYPKEINLKYIDI